MLEPHRCRFLWCWAQPGGKSLFGDLAPSRTGGFFSESTIATKSTRGRKQDRARVAGGQDYEVRYEAKKTGKSKPKVKRAAKKAGPSRKRVERALRGCQASEPIT